MSHPLHLTRFPVGLIPSTRRRTPRRIAWDIRHPLVLPLSLLVTLAAGAALLAWVLVLAVGYAVWMPCATIVRACSLPFRRIRPAGEPERPRQ